jgi:hypothetical protein
MFSKGLDPERHSIKARLDCKEGMNETPNAATRSFEVYTGFVRRTSAWIWMAGTVLFLAAAGAAFCLHWERPIPLILTMSPDRTVSVRVVLRRSIPPCPSSPVTVCGLVREEATGKEAMVYLATEDALPEAEERFSHAEWSGKRCSFPHPRTSHAIDVDVALQGAR